MRGRHNEMPVKKRPFLKGRLRSEAYLCGRFFYFLKIIKPNATLVLTVHSCFEGVTKITRVG